MYREQEKHGVLGEAVDVSWDSYFQKLFREEHYSVFVLSNYDSVVEQFVLFITGSVLVYKNLWNQYKCQSIYIFIIKHN